MTRVVGTAGHIDHGKTSLLRALTGIDADRLPEERRRGLTIDVGYAHLVTANGASLDFVDVPGHDRLVGNMLVGAGEIDACLLVVAADDGPRAQTIEHLALLDALALRDGVAAVTKADLVPAERVAQIIAQVRDLLRGTTLEAIPVLAVSATTGLGLDELTRALAAMAERAAPPETTRGPARLAVDRVFTIRGRGLVVTGTARGDPITVGQRLRALPDGNEVRVRALEVHDEGLERGPHGGRVALLLGGEGVERITRGAVLVAAPSAKPSRGAYEPVATRRALVALAPPWGWEADRAAAGEWPPSRDATARLHIGTDQADALVIVRGHHAARLADGSVTAILKLDRAVAAGVGDRFVLRRPPPSGLLAGGLVLDPTPPASRARRRQTPERLARLAAAVAIGEDDAIASARLDLHGLLRVASNIAVADDLRAEAAHAVETAVADCHAREPGSPGMLLTDVRRVAAVPLRQASGSPADVAEGVDGIIGALVSSGRVRRDGDVVAVAGHRPAAPDPARAAAVARLLAALDVAAPPPLRGAAAQAGCPPDAIRELEREERIVVVDEDLAWSRPAWERLRDLALGLARSGTLTPAGLRDASGTSRKYVMALLEDLQRRGILTRTPTGHVPGPRS